MSTDGPKDPASTRAASDAHRLQAVLDALPVPIFFKDAAGAYLGFNAAFEAYLGIPRERILGRTVFDVSPADLAEIYRQADERLLRAGGTQVYEARVQWADGSRRDVVFHKAVLTDPAGEAAGLVGAILDVTAQREAERARTAALESARAAQRLAALGTLAAGIGHELNNPLTFVLANVEHAAESLRRLRGAAPGDEAWEDAAAALDDAVEGAERMRVILRDLRTLARPEDRDDGAADVGALLESAAALASHEIRPRARLVWDVGAVPPVRGGAGRLGQVFVNLLVNAAHATPEGDPDAHVIKLSARTREDGMVEIAVQDSGAGIPPENLPRVFDPFFTTKPVGLGTGLGLWVCRSIVTAVGGAVEVESAVGRGTTFRVTLPAAPGEAGAAREDGRDRARDGRAIRKILVVDDEPLVTATVRRQLASDFAVEAASGPADALSRVATGRFDAVICDVMLEGATGLDVVEAIRATDPGLAGRVLLVTGGAPADVSSRIARLGAKVLAKPFGGRQLRAALAELIGAWAADGAGAKG